jgi:tetratricopeptide (TPR) repeat protein
MGEHRARGEARRRAGSGSSGNARVVVLGALLVAVTAGVYARVAHFEFVQMDDTQYVTRNAYVRQGLTAVGATYALTQALGGTWQPLALFSHMLDCELYGLDPVGHHVTNVALHIVDALLLFGVLRYMTAAVWESGFVAALFALHPLHVESVAWVSERKDVLSALFGLLSLWAYAAYARRPSAGRYVLTAALLALGLTAKPMLVTWPFVFLLLDYWPLGRMGAGSPAPPARRGVPRRTSTPGDISRESLASLVLEKVPFLTLAAVASLATFLTQSAGRAVRETIPLELRAANAVVSYVRYLGKTVWPADLAALYPHPYLAGGRPWDAWHIAGAGLVLLAVSALVVRSGRRYALVGWLWYLGTLVPVIGIVQVGYQAMADRYTYLPLIGIFVIVAWGSADLARAWGTRAPLLRPALALGAAAMLTAATVPTWFQLSHWRDSVALMRRIVEVTPDSPVGYYYLGTVHLENGNREEAARLYRRSLEIGPDYPRAHYNLANIVRDRGDVEQAIHHYRQALRTEPDFASAHVNLGVLLKAKGDLEGATRHFREAVRSWPTIAIPRKNLADVLRAQGHLEEAVEHYREAVRLRPGYARAHHDLGMTLRSLGRLEEANAHLERARQLSRR